MKLYLASSFKLVDRVQDVSDYLESEGFSITEKWWARIYDIEGKKIVTTDLKKINDDYPPESFYGIPETIKSFYLDFEGVMSANAFVFIASDELRKYNGACVELGLALGRKIPCYLLGRLENSVLFTPLIRCRNKEDLLGKLTDYVLSNSSSINNGELGSQESQQIRTAESKELRRSE